MNPSSNPPADAPPSDAHDSEKNGAEEDTGAENGPQDAESAEAEEPRAEEPSSTTTGDPDAPRSELDALREEHEALRSEHRETRDRMLRTAAELQNVRRRAAEEQRRRAASARASALRPLLEVLDDLQRALAADADAPGDANQAETARQSLRSGVEMVETKFEDALAGQGIHPIEAEGQPFDEALHEAMMQQPAPEGVAPGTVLAEVRRGYRMETSGSSDEGERVLRHSRVVVAAAAQEEASSENEEPGEGDGEEERAPNADDA